MHINCNEDLRCLHKIAINTSPSILLLQETVINTLLIISQENNEIFELLKDKHRIFQHIASYFNSFPNSTSFQ